MKARTRHVVGVALALAALSVFTSASAAQAGAAPTLRPGLTDFGLSHSQIAVPPQAQTVSSPQLKPGLRDFGLSYAQIAVPRAPQTASPQLKPGLRDFGLSYGRIAVPPASTSGPAAQQQVEIVPSRGFDWRDAGIGAAATLGIVLLVGGLGAGLVLRSHRREFLSA